MKLLKVTVQLFRNILDSSEVEIQRDVTCLVGKNESGKTAFLQALYRLKPARANAPMSVPDQYPAWLEKRHRSEGKDLEDVTPVSVVFELEAADRSAFDEVFGAKALRDKELHIARDYDNEWVYKKPPRFDEREAVQHVITTTREAKRFHQGLKSVSSFRDLAAAIPGVKATPDQPTAAAAAAALHAAMTKALGNCQPSDDFADAIAWRILEKRIPAFFYFSEYARLPYSVKIRQLLKTDEKQLTDDQLTARSLLRQAGAAEEYLLNPDYERRKRELENVANAITADVLTYWSQNNRLRVSPDITLNREQQQDGAHVVVDELRTRIWDDRHGLSLPFNEHSTGFQWFFSFLAAFSEFEHKTPAPIVLLDEPALGLHARAQADFLRFIDERLAKKCQVIYTTHSPFMIQPGKLERVRVVEDKGKEEGTKVTKEILTTDSDTLFPLQGALGYDLVQHLFVAPHNLLVEGTSDYTYLIVISDHLKQEGNRETLDERWSVLPVGGADLVPTFVALLGHHLDVTVVLDSRREGHQRLQRLIADGYLPKQRLVALGQLLGVPLADIEDLFEPTDYLLLFNEAFGTDFKVTDLVGSDPIVQRLARHMGVARYDHGKPADVLLRKRPELVPRFNARTFERFEQLFQRVNSTLPAI